MKRSLAILLAASFLTLLTQIPYESIRRERIRAFGESRAEAVIQELATDQLDGSKRYLITYRYLGPDGRARARIASISRERWERAVVGQRITVYVADALPNLARVEGEQEDPFAVWLRQTVRGDALPERERRE